EQQVDKTHMRTPEAGHYGRLAVERAGCSVDALDAFIVGARENQVVMAGQHNVDAVNGSELQRGVLHARNMFAAGYAGMRESHDDIDALFAHFWNPGLGSLNDVAHDDLAGKVGGVPGHDLG